MKTVLLLTTLLVATSARPPLAWNIPATCSRLRLLIKSCSRKAHQRSIKWKAILALHPWHSTRWQNSLATLSGTDSDVMLLMLAARWADDIRTNDKAQHRGPWHYVNMPFKPQGQPPHIETKPASSPNILTALEETGALLEAIPTRRRGPLRSRGFSTSWAMSISPFTQASYSLFSTPMAIRAATKSASGQDPTMKRSRCTGFGMI